MTAQELKAGLGVWSRAPDKRTVRLRQKMGRSFCRRNCGFQSLSGMQWKMLKQESKMTSLSYSRPTVRESRMEARWGRAGGGKALKLLRAFSCL